MSSIYRDRHITNIQSWLRSIFIVACRSFYSETSQDERIIFVDANYCLLDSESAIAQELCDIFDDDYMEIVKCIKLKMHWPLSFKLSLLDKIRDKTSYNGDALNYFANFVLDPGVAIPAKHHFGTFLPTIASIERWYGLGVCSIFYLQYGFILVNILTVIVWLSLIVVPYNVLESSEPNSTNITFNFLTIFTTEGYLAQSSLFQGSYPSGILADKYNLPLIYLVATYAYFFIWFLFLITRFATAYKKQLFDSILNSTRADGFALTFGRYDYSKTKSQHKENKLRAWFLQSYKELQKNKSVDDEHSKYVKSRKYKLKIFIGHLLHAFVAVGLGCLNWLLLSSCKKPTIDCYGSILYMVLLNRIAPYIIVVIAQAETFKSVPISQNNINIRCALVTLSTVLSFVICFFLNPPDPYETAFGQFIYILLLGDAFASLLLPLLCGIIFDLLLGRKYHRFDGVNIHVQLSSPVLLYSQFLVWMGTYFSPLISIMAIINILFSFISHRLYIFVHSRRAKSRDRVFVWNLHRIEYSTYLLATGLLIISVTCFVVFTTQIKPSGSGGPFKDFEAAYEIVEELLTDKNISALWLSIINFLTTPGFIYFLTATFIAFAYKLRHEEMAEKKLVFIHSESLSHKKKFRDQVVKKLREESKKKKGKRRQIHQRI